MKKYLFHILKTLRSIYVVTMTELYALCNNSNEIVMLLSVDTKICENFIHGDIKFGVILG
jgi:hypothetical protein